MDITTWARELMTGEDDWCILDTETTGLEADDEIVEISIIDRAGQVLLDQMIRPWKAIPPAATAIHGITYEDVATQPSFVRVMPAVYEVLKARKRVVVYNAAYDRRMLIQTANKSHIMLFMSPRPEQVAVRSPLTFIMPIKWECLMERYAEYWGEPGRYGFRWQRLQEACRQQEVEINPQWHRALGDCRATLELIKVLSSKYAVR